MIPLQVIANNPNWAEQVQALVSIAGLFGMAAIIATLLMQQTTLVLQQKATP